MKTIQLDIVQHKGSTIVLIKFPVDTELQSILRQIPNVHWSRTFKAWYVAYSVPILHQIKKLFEPVCTIDATLLKEHIPKHTHSTKSTVIQLETKQKFDFFVVWMRSRRYSENTIKTYTEALRVFLQYFADRPLSQITNNDVITFNNEFIIKNKLSASYQNQIVNAIKLFFGTIENISINIHQLDRPRREWRLPNILSMEEVASIITSLENIKHRSMLALIYSAGLRRSELLALKCKDIDSTRMVITIRAAKGKKDRIVPLSELVLEMLRTYYKEYKPTDYLFEGQNGGAYSEKSLEEVFHKAKKLAGVRKKVSLHTLRHSYATHLLEGGTNLRYIQELLGHKSSKTTEIYTHVSNQAIQKITSPLDKLKMNK